MKILLDDGMQIAVGTGIGKYSMSLYKGLLQNNVDVQLSDYNPPKRGKMYDRLHYLYYINSSAYQEYIKQFDYVLYTNYAVPFVKNSKTKYSVTIHDLVAFLYPDTLPFMYRYYSQAMIRNACEKADLIFTVSNSARNDIVAKFPKVKNKIHAIWAGLYDDRKPLSEYPPYENCKLTSIDNVPFFLFVSTIEKRKNVGMVIDAFLKLKEGYVEASEYKLVLAGRPGYGYSDFLAKVNASNYAEDVIFAGYVSDSDCNRLYNHAKAFVFPTVYEGFGSAQIECMNCHLPIILSDIPTNREISREYGEYFDLSSTESLVKKMRIFVDNKYNDKEKEGISNIYIKDFDWLILSKKLETLLKNN